MKSLKLASVKFGLTSAIVLTPMLSSCGQGEQGSSKLQEAPDANNKTTLMGVKVQRLDDLKTSAQLSNIGWSGDYWATANAGIAYRWLSENQGESWRDRIYPIATAGEVEAMTQAEIDELSPAEKFDLYQGRLDFPLTNEEFRRTRKAVDASGEVPNWFGICHGWAPAAIMEEEPGNVASVPGPFGKTINFYSADLKALISRQYADAKVPTNFLGGRCNAMTVKRDSQGRNLQPECRDTNPASLHLILADLIGKQNRGFVADITVDAEVWNQPVVGYSAFVNNRRDLSAEPGYSHAAPGTVELVDVQLELNYLVEAGADKYKSGGHVDFSEFAYTLELDGQGFIIGGEWITEDRPDFLWELIRKPEQDGDSTIDYQTLKKLLEMSNGK